MAHCGLEIDVKEVSIFALNVLKFRSLLSYHVVFGTVHRLVS